MGLFDDVTDLVGKGMDAVNERNYLTKLQSELNGLQGQKNSLYAQIGRQVWGSESCEAALEDSYQQYKEAFKSIEAQEQSVRQQIFAAQGMANPYAGVQGATMPCPACCAQIRADAKFCPSCGTNIEQARSQA